MSQRAHSPHRRKPPVLSTGIVSLAAVGSLVITAVSTLTLVGSAIGVVLLIGGLIRGSSTVFQLGTVALVGTIVLAGLSGAGSVFVLSAAFLTVIAWDVGQNALSIGTEVGRDVSTHRIEIVHAVGSVVVLATGVSITYAVYRTITGPQPILAVIALLIGVITILFAFEQRS